MAICISLKIIQWHPLWKQHSLITIPLYYKKKQRKNTEEKNTIKDNPF